jgi:hypothetical protein
LVFSGRDISVAFLMLLPAISIEIPSAINEVIGEENQLVKIS